MTIKMTKTRYSYSLVHTHVHIHDGIILAKIGEFFHLKEIFQIQILVGAIIIFRPL